MTFKKILFWLPRISISSILLISSPVIAQVIPDSTLPTNSNIKKQGNVTLIEGGTIKGSNLFHSLKEFSIPSGSKVYFNNSSDIQSIFTRITGSSISNINGLIQTNGKSNLFLINPNGFIFGKDASLNIGGSFFASTANSVKFADGFEFNTTDSSVPLLTISVPIGLGFATNTGKIEVKGDSILATQNQLLSPFTRGVEPSGLSVKKGKTLGLIGGNLILNGATLTAEDGQIELGSVAENSFVDLIPINQGWTLGYKKESSFKDIQLLQGSLVDASGVAGGSIQAQGANIKITDGSVFLIQNLGSRPNAREAVTKCQRPCSSGSDASKTLSHREFHHHFVINFLSFSNTQP